MCSSAANEKNATVRHNGRGVVFCTAGLTADSLGSKQDKLREVREKARPFFFFENASTNYRTTQCTLVCPSTAVFDSLSVYFSLIRFSTLSFPRVAPIFLPLFSFDLLAANAPRISSRPRNRLRLRLRLCLCLCLCHCLRFCLCINLVSALLSSGFGGCF